MDWHPQRDLEIVAGTPPGGGLDRTARALLHAIEAHRLIDVGVRVTNVPGDGARKAWAYMDGHRADPHVVSISHPNLTTDHLVGIASFDHRSYTPVAVLYTEYIAFVTRSGSALETPADLLEQLSEDAGSLTVALSTALGNPNHIALAQVARHAGADPKACRIRVFDSAIDAVADVVAGHADIATVTAASALKAFADGKVQIVAISAPERLAQPFASVPTWREQPVECVIGAWRGVSGACDIAQEHVAFWERVLHEVVQTAEWNRELQRHCWTASYLDGPQLRTFLEQERNEMAATLATLGLARA